MSKRKSKPVIRILHQLPRSGGTLISKCLGSMQNVVLLSEIHPDITMKLAVLKQADQWFHLLTPSDHEWLKKNEPLAFSDRISLLARRCKKNGQTLVLRDWSHIDFIAVPFVSAPGYQLTSAKLLQGKFSVCNTAIVRHPFDQWGSLIKRDVMKGRLSAQEFLHGYLRFAECCVDIGFVRYEDFTDDPDTWLRVLCKRLTIPFDPGYQHRWYRYTKLTGDVQDSRGRTKIERSPQHTPDPDLLAQFTENNDYRKAISLLGYSDPD